MDLSFLVIGLLFFLRALSWLIIIRILMSWFAPRSRNPIALFIYETSDTVLRPIRRIIRPKGNMDWTPLVAIILIDVIQYGVIRLFS